jgi:hypothetical protein
VPLYCDFTVPQFLFNTPHVSITETETISEFWKIERWCVGGRD